MFESIHHISYTVSNLDRTIPFYRDILEFEFIHDVERENIPAYDVIFGFKNVRVRIAAFRIPCSQWTLELMQFHDPKPIIRPQGFAYAATSHAAYLVKDIEGEYRRLQSHGVRWVGPVAEIHRDGRYIGKAVFLLDPDDILIEPMELAKS